MSANGNSDGPGTSGSGSAPPPGIPNGPGIPSSDLDLAAPVNQPAGTTTGQHPAAPPVSPDPLSSTPIPLLSPDHMASIGGLEGQFASLMDVINTRLPAGTASGTGVETQTQDNIAVREVVQQGGGSEAGERDETGHAAAVQFAAATPVEQIPSPVVESYEKDRRMEAMLIIFGFAEPGLDTPEFFDMTISAREKAMKKEASRILPGDDSDDSDGEDVRRVGAVAEKRDGVPLWPPIVFSGRSCNYTRGAISCCKNRIRVAKMATPD